MAAHPDRERTEARAGHRRLWFSFAGAGAAWALALALDVIWTGRGCPRADTMLLLPAETWMQIALGLITFGFLALAAGAGFTAYRTWRGLAGPGVDLVEAEGRGRQEFMSLFGLIVSASLGVGIIWFSLAVYLLSSCVRAY